MAIVVKRIKRANGREYYNLVDVRRVNGKVVTKYVGYLGKTPGSIQELTAEQLLPYVRRLIDTGITDVDMTAILKKIGVETDVWPITKIIIENDRHLKKLLLRFR